MSTVCTSTVSSASAAQTRRCRCRADYGRRPRGHHAEPPPAAPAQSSAKATDRQNSPLHAAAFSGDVTGLRTLLGRGEDVNLATLVGETPLHLAAELGHTAAVELLLECGASTHATDQHGDVALHCAAPNADAVRLLLRHGAPVDACNHAGDRPLHAAAFSGQRSCLQLLLAAKAAVDAPGHGGETALAIAALRGATDAMTCLLEHGASVHAVDDAGDTALHAAARFGAVKSGRVDCVELLIARGCVPTPECIQLIHRSAKLMQAQAAPSPAVVRGHSAAWQSRMRRMPPLTRQLLVENAEPSTVDALCLLLEQVPPALSAHGAINSLTKYRGARRGLQMELTSAVLTVRSAISAEGCERLRWAVDHNGTVSTDVVDGLPNRDLALTVADMRHILGRETTQLLLGLPDRFNAQPPRAAEHGGRRMTLVGGFARRYSADTVHDDQPLTSFHFDSAAVTVNVAICDDETLAGGGRLLGLVDGSVKALLRAEGEATVHSSSLLHGVSRIHTGVRFSLILFFAFQT